MGSNPRRFLDRTDAGRELAILVQRAVRARDVRDVVVLALPRGGVPVAAQVANELHAPLDILVVRKIGLPANPEVAVGAIGPEGVVVLDHDFMRRFGLAPHDIESVIARERAELERREHTYRAGYAAVPIAGRNVIIVDDGLATGASMSVAVSAVREQGAAVITVAVPVAAPSAANRLSAQADAVISILTPPHFRAVGEWYDDFSQTSDEEVRLCLQASDAAFRRLA